MKKITIPLIFFVFFLVFTEKSHSQAFRAGLIAGINGSHLTGERGAGLRQFGLTAGPFVQYEINEDYGLRTEILFSQKGARKQPRPDIGDYDLYVLRMNYVDVPVLLTYKQNNFIFEIGPSFNYLISANERDQHSDLLFQRPFRTFEFAGNIGINYHIARNLDMNWRFTHSLVPVRQHFGGGTWRINRGQYNAVLSFRFIYWIGTPDE